MMSKQSNLTSIETEMKQSYLEYAMSVIIGRALPDVRDGLKPVHRRILYAMHQLSNDWNKPYKKSARIVGDVIGKYHPHGDSAVYDSIVRMAQNFSLRYTLINGQGNFGSVDGDSPAAMRYTEIRMSKLAHQMLSDLEKNTVDFSLNYDETLNEPTVLPSKFPALLLNGSSGIAVGMTTNVPPHNIKEVVEGLKALIDNPNMDTRAIMHYIPGPDFPTYGHIYGTKGIFDAYDTGRGIISLRAVVDIEEEKNTGRQIIVVNELPYQTNKAKLVEKIAELVRDKIITGVSFVRDESDRDGMRIAIGLKKGQFSETVINQLYKHTNMQTSFGIIFLAIVNNRPELLTLKKILNLFIEHRKHVILRRTRFDLNKAKERLHILEGLKIALENLDDVVTGVRNSESAEDAKNNLIQSFTLSAIQAQAILDIRLHKLTSLERKNVNDEHEDLRKAITWYDQILSSDEVVRQLIKDELTQLSEEYGDNRRTRIIEHTVDISLEDLIVEEDMVVTVTRNGYIKRNPVTLYTSQHRGGKGKTAMGTKSDDFVELLFVASTHSTFLFITNFGKVYQTKVYELPMASRSSLGNAIVNLINFTKGEKLTTVLVVDEFVQGKYVVMATKKGRVKKTDLMAYSRPRSEGLIGVKLAKDDELIAARITDGTMNILLGSDEGKVIRFHEKEVRSTNRGSMGVKGMQLGPVSRVVGMEVLKKEQTLLAVTENGYGKRSLLEEYRTQSRGGKGIFSIKTSQRNGKMVAMALVDDHDEIMMITNKGKLIRTAIQGITIIARHTQGVKLINLTDGENLIGIARLPEESHEENEAI